jgi:hypothetical protein
MASAQARLQRLKSLSLFNSRQWIPLWGASLTCPLKVRSCLPKLRWVPVQLPWGVPEPQRGRACLAHKVCLTVGCHPCARRVDQSLRTLLLKHVRASFVFGLLISLIEEVCPTSGGCSSDVSTETHCCVGNVVSEAALAFQNADRRLRPPNGLGIYS